jgi:hypothetical protein
MKNPVNKKRYPALFTALIGLLAMMLFMRYLLWNTERPQAPESPAVIIKPRSPHALSNNPGKIAKGQPGVIDLADFGQIQYHRHRTVRVADLMKFLNSDDSFGVFISRNPNVLMEVYEDEDGYLVFLSHNAGHYRSEPRDSEVVNRMSARGSMISPMNRPMFRMDDDEFVTVLLKEIERMLTWESEGAIPELTKELVIWPASIEFDERYKGPEKKGERLPVLMFRKSSGTSSEFYYEERIPREETYLRAWGVWKYEKPAANKEVVGLISVEYEVLVERRLDLEE